MYNIFTLILLTLLSIKQPALAEDSIKDNLQKISILFVEPNDRTLTNELLFKTILSDLNKIDKFCFVNNNDFLSNKQHNQNFEKIYYLEYKSFFNPIDHKYNISFYLTKGDKKKLIDSANFRVDEQEIRLISHRISDRVYENITGINGFFSSKIAYILKKNDTYELQISDYDGENQQVALRSKDPISSPKWSPDGKKISYISFEKKKPSVFLHTLSSGERIELVKLKNIGSSPSWSNDGTKIAIAILNEGTTQIYFIDLSNIKEIKQITNSFSINTEPIFTQKNDSIIFTSDRSGNPQIYKTNILNNDHARRITFNGNYNVSPNISKDNRNLLFVSKQDEKFCIKILNLSNQREIKLTDGPYDFSPSFSPNDMYILHTSIKNNRSSLCLISKNGSIIKKIDIPGCDIQSAAWGPIIK